jgi:signal transduction histidine kinase/AraC-like DNA-binding protein/DNA-binding LytR/AlgR family response regulator
LRDRSAWLRAESLWQQARVMLGETGQRSQAYQALQAQEETRILAGIGQALGNAVSLKDLEQAIVEALPRLGIRRAYLALYEDPAAPAQDARLVMGCDEGRALALEPGGRPFSSRQLTPLDLPVERRCDLVVEPLFYRDEQLGFVVFEAGPDLEEECEILCEQIAGALKRSELYRQAEQARRVAEEGRRLAEEANQLKSRFLSTVSHELRTPLSLIVGTIEMLLRERRRRDDLPIAYQRDLRSIHTSAQHLARLISDVLDLASSQVGELRLVNEPVRLSEVLAQATMLGEVMAQEKNLSWESDIPADLPVVWGDRTRLQQVVLNLIGNAVKFTEQGYVRLWAEAGKHRLVVAVTDSGMGIPLAEQEFIFDEFRQSERAARRGYGGMGLGLAISKRLVELHGGVIGVLSTGADGAGSTFFFTLPVMQMDAETATGGEERTGTVLVLTEQATTGEPLARHLAARGFTVETVAPAAHPNWLGQIIAAPPGAILLDFEPAVERGWELMQVLRNHPATQDIPVIFYNLAEAEAHGAALALDFVAKPLAAGTLARALARQGLDADQLDGQTILIVDDEPGILVLHARLLEELTPRCHILQARNGQEALALMARQRPDLVLLDLMMPVLDGFGVLEAMRQCAGTRDIPVIVLTAQVLTRQDMARLQQGVAAVLSKGLFTGAEVLGQVTQALRRNRRLGSEAQRVVRQAMAYIHEHCAETFSREDLAQAVGLSDRYLTQCFHAETGITPVAYLNRYRITQARDLLERGELNITEVALAAGFTDPSYFARVFRAEVGVTPSAYRRGERGAI